MKGVLGAFEGEGWIWRRAALVFVLALAWKAAIVMASGHYQSELMGEVPQTGRTLAAKGLFGDPFNIPTGPTAHVAPVCAAVIGAVYWTLGFGQATQWALVGIGLLFSALTWTGLQVFAEKQGLGVRAALMASAAGALFPFQYRCETTFSESAVGPVLLMGAGAMALRLWGRGMETWKRAAGYGAASGAMMLTLPTTAAVVMPAVAVGAVMHWRRSGEAVRMVCFAVALAAVLAPWTWRNYEHFGAVFFIRDNMGMELQVSNNEAAAALGSDNNPRVTATIHPNRSKVECRRLIEMGEVAYNADKMRQFKAWLAANPGRFAELTAQRFFYFWIPLRGNIPGLIAETMVAGFGLAGVWLAWRRRLAVARYLVLALATFPPVYYIVQADERYGYPVRWVLYLGCGYVLSEITGWYLARRGRRG